MDIDVFKDDNFCAIDWINKCYEENATSRGGKEVFVAAMVEQLQAHVQSMNASLEETSQHIITTMPKIYHDVQGLNMEAAALQLKMAEVQAEIATVHRETGSSMANLERLDRLKTKLQTAKEGLQESDSWGRLTTELEDLLDQNDMVGACEKIHTLQRSLIAQTGLPGQAERESELEEAKNKLEALASPHVVRCFTTADVDGAKNYVNMFEKIDRLGQLKQYYRTVQKASLQRHWAELLELAENANSCRFVREFYDYLGENWQKQLKWCEQVFVNAPSAAIEPNQIVIETLARLEPSRETAITQAMKRATDKLDVLQEVSSANAFFGALMQKLLQHHSEAVPEEQLAALSKVIYDYFGAFIGHYAALEQNWLAQQLVQLNLNETVSSETVRVLGQSNGKIVQFIQVALQRCESITKNCAIGSLVTVIQTYCRDYMDKYRRAQKQLEASRTMDENWNLIQACTTLLQHVGDFMSTLARLEDELKEVISRTYEQVCHQKASTFQYKILKKAEVNELRKLVSQLGDADDGGGKGAVATFKLFQSLIEGTIRPVCADIHETTLVSIFVPIERHLRNIEMPRDGLRGDENLPDYSFAPQEYITQIGQYLMTLPQHLEPLLLSPSDALRLAFEMALGDKYGTDGPCGEVLLGIIAENTCNLFLELIIKGPTLDNVNSKQLATDIEYLGSVLEELGLALTGKLQQSVGLLRATQENYSAVATGCEPKLVMAIRQKRNIVLN